MSQLIVVVLSGLFLAPFCLALFYFMIGMRSYFIGKKENNRTKTISGMNGAAFAFLGMCILAFIWYLLFHDAYGW